MKSYGRSVKVDFGTYEWPPEIERFYQQATLETTRRYVQNILALARVRGELKKS